MYKFIAEILEILENNLTKGKIELNSFSIDEKQKEKLKELENKKYFKEYKITFWKNTFRIEAIPFFKELVSDLLLFDRLNDLFKDLPIEKGIGCGGGLFLFSYNGDVMEKPSLISVRESQNL